MTASSVGGHAAAILVINAGSSSVKYELIRPDTATILASGVVERVGRDDTILHHRVPVPPGSDAAVRADRSVGAGDAPDPRSAEPLVVDIALGRADHHRAVEAIVEAFDRHGPRLRSDSTTGTRAVTAVGHRVVMGGPEFYQPTLINDALIDRIDELAPLAPLHNPANAAAIRIARELLPDVPHIAVFDTAFFHDLPAHSARYAIDPSFAEQRSIRRYGFHGISHEYVSSVVTDVLSTRPAGGDGSGPLRQVIMHLGNGASASAVVDGRPVDTSMGFTPLEGLVMGTRSGDIDPSVAFYLIRHHGMTIDEVDHLLNHESGMAAMAGSNDLRDVHDRIDAGDGSAAIALDIYVHRLRRYIGAYAAVMGGLDALTFTAGVGENDARVRATAIRGLEFMGVELDPVRNDRGGEPIGGHTPARARLISTDRSPVRVLVVPTHEELSIAQQTASVVAVA